VTNVEDATRSTRLLAATTLRNVLGTKTLSEILQEREHISDMMKVGVAPSLESITIFALNSSASSSAFAHLVLCVSVVGHH
jgi:erythrocyte band 7 integral membrane protein